MALSSGGDYSEIYVEDTDATSLTMSSGKMETAVSGRNFGAGVRVFHGTNSVYVYTNDGSETGLARRADHGLLGGDLGQVAVREAEVRGDAGCREEQLVRPQIAQRLFRSRAAERVMAPPELAAGREQGDVRDTWSATCASF